MENIYDDFNSLSYQKKTAAVEALIFAANEPITTEMLFKIFNVDGEMYANSAQDKHAGEQSLIAENSVFENIIRDINISLEASARPYRINKVAGGYIFATNPEYGELLSTVSKYKIKKRLSPASLETLAIIAYKQPVSKPEIEQIRGVNSNEIVNSLIEKEFVKIIGRREILGRPLTYGTTPQFLQTFGLNSIEELPRLREIDEILADDDIKSAGENITLEIPTETENCPSEPPAPVIPDYDENIE